VNLCLRLECAHHTPALRSLLQAPARTATRYAPRTRTQSSRLKHTRYCSLHCESSIHQGRHHGEIDAEAPNPLAGGRRGPDELLLAAGHVDATPLREHDRRRVVPPADNRDLPTAAGRILRSHEGNQQK